MSKNEEYNEQRMQKKKQNNQKGQINQKETSPKEQVEGRNAVLELLESGKDINKIYIESGEKTGSINKIIALAKEKPNWQALRE